MMMMREVSVCAPSFVSCCGCCCCCDDCHASFFPSLCFVFLLLVVCLSDSLWKICLNRRVPEEWWTRSEKIQSVILRFYGYSPLSTQIAEHNEPPQMTIQIQNNCIRPFPVKASTIFNRGTCWSVFFNSLFMMRFEKRELVKTKSAAQVATEWKSRPSKRWNLKTWKWDVRTAASTGVMEFLCLVSCQNRRRKIWEVLSPKNQRDFTRISAAMSSVVPEPCMSSPL